MKSEYNFTHEVHCLTVKGTRMVHIKGEEQLWATHLPLVRIVIQ